ncbi:helix-turn-helix transcriptional regulator [Flavobacterium sp. SUN046]|uniref:helix-turn-helix domain-containing protein n=1 Tax=Flavobacterium sp. SUN046 TaxID=3002440 RepID=UPI002DB95CC8|nr:helix-turn-helix transcriptional regulator [Flavobacterium sp. SUN046]MEC4048437.1 helix-turn-helix transcriptional regulator [Flavobacterium sp. SUN046]
MANEIMFKTKVLILISYVLDFKTLFNLAEIIVIMEIGTKLRKLRERKKMSPESLAHLIGVSEATILKWEQGTSIKHTYISKLSEVLDVPADYLIEEKQVKIVNNTDNKDNSINAFEVKLKIPKSAFKSLFEKMDKLIELLDKDNQEK